MSQIKELKLNKDNINNVVEFFEIITPNVKTKYYELFLKLLKKSIEDKYGERVSEAKNTLSLIFPEQNENFEKMSTFNILFTSYMFDVIHDLNFNVETLQNFIDFNEKNLIEKNDLTSYKSYDELHNQVMFCEMKNDEKKLEKQVVRLFEDKNWLMLKPLTYEASVKYGYNTKWCTAMENDKSYFTRYAKEGILIYFMNKSTNEKVAVYKRLYNDRTKLSGTTDITFWNQVDTQIDSFNSKLPGYLLDELRKHFELHNISNTEVLGLITKDDKNPPSNMENNTCGTSAENSENPFRDRSEFKTFSNELGGVSNEVELPQRSGIDLRYLASRFSAGSDRIMGEPDCAELEFDDVVSDDVVSDDAVSDERPRR